MRHCNSLFAASAIAVRGGEAEIERLQVCEKTSLQDKEERERAGINADRSNAYIFQTGCTRRTECLFYPHVVNLLFVYIYMRNVSVLY